MHSREQNQAPVAVVVGSYNTDLLIWCDTIPTRGQSLMGGDFEMFCGGRGANCAVAAARAGCKVIFIGAHGPDLFGKMARDRLATEGIDISHFVELPSSKTGVSLVFHERAAGAHAALIATSANNAFPAALVRKAQPAIRQADLVFTQFGIAREAFLEVLRLCKHWKKRLVLQAAPIDASTYLPNGNYYLLVLDQFDALTLTRQDNLDAAILELHRRGAEHVIVKLNYDSLSFSNSAGRKIQPIPTAKFVQRAGTTECLTAWAGITLTMTGDLSQAAYMGAEAMAVSLSRHGAQDSMPRRSELSL
ncbi:MAG: hypothetical protein JO271_09315 [Verrucomicrobia bacterium]|nr:hypothetical protein [Verrucomicrobiota bacterium]